MADPCSVTASVIAVAGLAYSSAKKLKELITSFSDAPQVLHDLGTDLGLLQSLMQALQQSLEGVSNADLSNDQKACFESLKPALEACKGMCDTFTSKLSKMTSRSQAGRVNWWDRARIHFNTNDIAILKSDLEKYKQTVDVAIEVATLKMASQEREVLQNLETKITTSVDNFTGQIMGLHTALQSMSVADIAIRHEDVQTVARALNEHERVLKFCLESCTSGLKVTTARAGTQIKYARTFNEARQAIGNMGNITRGGPPTVVDYAEARDKSIQHVGHMDADVAKDFWTRE